MSKSQKPETLADTLRRFIAESGESLNGVGRVAGIDPGVLSRFMRRERDIGLATAGKIAAGLGLRLVSARKR